MLMEHRSIENIDGSESRKKSRSLDIQSIYNSRVSKEILNKILKRKRPLYGAYDNGGTVKKSKSRKEVPLSSLEKKNTRNLGEVCGGCGMSSGSNISEKPISNSLTLDDNGFKIPKRPRGFVGRKKVVNQLSEPLLAALPRSNKIVSVDEAIKSLGASCNVDNLTKKPKMGNDIKEKMSIGFNVDRTGRKEDGVSNINNGDVSSKKYHVCQRRKKTLMESTNSPKGNYSSVDNPNKKYNGLHEYDEDNLEQNAARMLSSRFNPNCTGFSSNMIDPMSPSSSGRPFLNFSHNFINHEVKSEGITESSLLDSAGRVLRPRTQRKQKGLSRKRRHFYEILSQDFDARWVLNRRIKVFWPLDQSWYFGFVNYYDSKRELHHVKYDDRDEEWIDLQHERFKLLLLPSEVPGKSKKKKLLMNDEQDEDFSVGDHGFINSFMDSEPIISWLARSSRRAKSVASSVLKKQETSFFSPASSSSYLLRKTGDGDECVHNGYIGREGDANHLSHNHISSEGLPNLQYSANHEMAGDLSSKFEELPRVYFRRRYHKKRQQMCLGYSVSGISPDYMNAIPAVDGLVDDFCVIEQSDSFCPQIDTKLPYWISDNTGLIILTIPLVTLRQFMFLISFWESPFFRYPFRVDCLMFKTLFLLRHGTVMSLWPIFHLEMLFVDDIIGARLLLFKGCLLQALEFFVLALALFYHPNEQRNRINLQLPVTSIWLKISCSQNLKRQLVFASYHFSKLKTSKWLCLDSKIGTHCSLVKKLPLSECTYDNIKTTLQCGSSDSITRLYQEFSSIEGSWKASREGLLCLGIPKDLSYVTMRKLYFIEKMGEVPIFSLSFNAVSTFFLGMHLKLLSERSVVASISLQDQCPLTLRDSLENSHCMTVDECSLIKDCSSKGLQLSAMNDMTDFSNDTCSKLLSLHKTSYGDTSCVPVTSASFFDATQFGISFELQNGQCSNLIPQCGVSPSSFVPRDFSFQGNHDASCSSSLNDISVEIQSVNEQAEKPVNKIAESGIQSDLCWSMNDFAIRSPNPTAPRSLWHRNRNSSRSSFSYLSHMWTNRKPDEFYNSFGNGPKKPRTQVSYMMPFGGHDINSRNQSPQYKRLSHKRIRKTSERRTDLSKMCQRDLDLLSCDANLLITTVDKGWREQGVQVALKLTDHNEWRLSVKVSGATRYMYKATEFLQPGTTNRYTHEMMWKGGKDWILEFPNRSQWMLFKELHEECYNRNFRAALKKHIPIPGVFLINESDDNRAGVPFLRMSPKYHRQLEADVDMAMNPSRILYDMDSDDEKWVSNCNASDITMSNLGGISEELFEKAMSMFERFAYAQKCDEFTSDELDELFTGSGPPEVINHIYKHWLQKKQKKKIPLIRQFQPPQWEWYQQQMNEWNQAMASSAFSNEMLDPSFLPEKPPLVAFCLKPRGLEVPNRGSKHRAQKKLSVAGHFNSFSGDQDGFHPFGRRSNNLSYGEHTNGFGDASVRVYSDLSLSSSDEDGNNNETALHPKSRQRFPKSRRYYYPEDSDLSEFRLRNASAAARRASDLAKMKREKAERFLHRADRAIHKAAVALMAADALKGDE